MSMNIEHIDDSYYINNKLIDKEYAIKSIIQRLKEAAEIEQVSNAQYALARLYYNNTLIPETIEYMKNIPDLKCKCYNYYINKIENINYENINFKNSRYEYFGEDANEDVYKKCCSCINDSFILNINADSAKTKTNNELNTNESISLNNVSLNTSDNLGNYTINSHDYWKQCENICNFCSIVKAFNEISAYKLCLRSAQQNNPSSQCMLGHFFKKGIKLVLINKKTNELIIEYILQKSLVYIFCYIFFMTILNYII